MTDFVYLDSGTGGIPYLNFLKERYPEYSCVYVGDTANFPYGEKSHEQVVDCVLSLVSKIIQKFKPYVIVVACNTMSVNALDVLREAFPEVSFVGTVPAIKLAASISKKRNIGLLATNSTINHPYTQDLINHFAKDCKLFLRGDPEFISFIEHKSFTATKEECIKAITPGVEFFKEKDCDCIILGCTHFLNLAGLIQEVCGSTIKVVDSREGVTNRAITLIKGIYANEKTCDSQNADLSRLYVTGFSDKKDEKEYSIICKRYNLEFGGIL